MEWSWLIGLIMVLESPFPFWAAKFVQLPEAEESRNRGRAFSVWTAALIAVAGSFLLSLSSVLGWIAFSVPMFIFYFWLASCVGHLVGWVWTLHQLVKSWEKKAE